MIRAEMEKPQKLALWEFFVIVIYGLILEHMNLGFCMLNVEA